MSRLEHDFGRDLDAGLLQRDAGPCLSLYLPTARHHPDNRQDPIRYGNLVKSLEQSLARRYPTEASAGLLAPFHALSSDTKFWEHSADGLAVLGHHGGFHVYRLQRPVRPLAIVADSFHVKPLLRIRQSADRFQILGLDRGAVTLYEGNRYALDEVALAEAVPRTLTDALGEQLTEPHQTVARYGAVRGAHSYGPRRPVGGAHSAMHHGHGGSSPEVENDTIRFFRAVDRAILEHHSRRAKLPLLLAALPEHQATFQRISDNPYLQPEGLRVHPGALDSLDALRERAWAVLAPGYEARMRTLAESFGTARAQELADDSLEAVARAAITGRVKTLLIEAERQLPGRIDAAGRIVEGELADPSVDDVLDDLGELVGSLGGEVVVVPAEHMPTATGVAAIYRFRGAGGGAEAGGREDLEKRTVPELYDMARALRIRGRSSMRKAELVTAIRDASR